jgi:hypothetical protein
MEQQLNELAGRVAAKHVQAHTVQEELVPLRPEGPTATVSATPVDRAFEFGFDPLGGGYRAPSIEGGESEIVER